MFGSIAVTELAPLRSYILTRRMLYKFFFSNIILFPLYLHLLTRLLLRANISLGMASILRAYNAALIRRPMLTQCATAAFLFGTGDIIAQQAIEKAGNKHDFARTARLTFYGGVLFGPAMTKWYQLLNRIQFKTPTRAVIYRVYMDQCLLTPVAVGFFFGSMSLLEGKPDDIMPRIYANYAPTIIRNWGVFVPTQLINFWLVPPHLRFVLVSVVSLFWNTYLSAINARNKVTVADLENPGNDAEGKIRKEEKLV